MKRSNLLAGLVLLVIAAAAPAFAVLVDLQRELRHDRETQVNDVALRQAELLSASLGNVVEGTRQMMLTATAAQPAHEAGPDCTSVLEAMRRAMPSYTVLALVRRDGTPICSDAASPMQAGALSGLVQPYLPVSTFTTGGFADVPGIAEKMLTFALPFTQEGGTDTGVMIAGLELSRLQRVLADLPQVQGGRFVVADHTGRILAERPAQGAVGRQVSPEHQSVLHAAAAGVILAEGDGSGRRVIGYVPPAPNGDALFIGAGFDVAAVVGSIDHEARRGYWLILLGTAISLLLALLIGHRYLRVPASVLLAAARRWGSGDLSARATMPPGAASEFTGLGHAFNEMAALLQQQRGELQALNEALELRVSDRTRALLESNNRLQVEIAERELTEASLRQAQKLQAVGQLAGGMAHDFNNVLTVILGSLELLRNRLLAADGRSARLLDTATEAVERGSRLTSQLLAFSRKQPLIAVSVDVAEAIRGMAGLLTSTLGAAIRLDARVDDALWPAMLDPNQFEVAILNLALNARDALPSGGRLSIAATNVALTPASPWSELAAGDYVCVTVADSGCGMSAEIANRAFEPFFTTKPPGKGSGLGLSQVHGMVRQSGGSVSIESRPGDGTKVIMMLPRSLSDPAVGIGGLDYSKPALGRTQAVLLVDDDDQVRGVTEAVLLDSGYTVLTARNGTAALEVLGREAGRIGLVIADYAMPGMTGRELLHTVRQHWPGIAVLLATGYADYPELTGQELPIDQIVRKPFRSNELLARMHMVIQRQASADALQDGLPVG